MPHEWLAILNNSKNKLHDFNLLKYELTVSDVYDYLEVMEVERFYHLESERIRDASR